MASYEPEFLDEFDEIAKKKAQLEIELERLKQLEKLSKRLQSEVPSKRIVGQSIHIPGLTTPPRKIPQKMT